MAKQNSIPAFPLEPALVDQIRAWKVKRNEIMRLKAVVDPVSKEKVVARADSLTRKEADERKTICVQLPGDCMMVVDGEPLVYSRTEQTDPNDKRFEIGWQRLQSHFVNDPAMLRLLDKLLPAPTPRIVHKLS